jgi:hypothetical protein
MAFNIPKIQYREFAEDGGDKKGYIADAEQHFQVMPFEVVTSYNKMVDTLMLMHRYWAQVVEAAWEAGRDKEMFESLLQEAKQQ